MLTALTLLKYNYLSIEPADTTRDEKLTSAIEAASEFIENHCGQPIEQVEKEFYFSGQGKANLSLVQQVLGGADLSSSFLLPWTTPVDFVSLAYRVDPLSSWTAIASDMATVYETLGCNYVYCRQGLGWPQYRLIANVGYTSVPSDLQHACCQVALYFYNETKDSGNARAGVNSVSTTQGGLTTTQAFKDVLAQVATVLNKYKIYA